MTLSEEMRNPSNAKFLHAISRGKVHLVSLSSQHSHASDASEVCDGGEMELSPQFEMVDAAQISFGIVPLLDSLHAQLG
jgi:hypothetical protein